MDSQSEFGDKAQSSSREEDDASGSQFKEGSEDAFSSASQSASGPIEPQYKEGATHVTLEILSLARQDDPLATQEDTQPSIPPLSAPTSDSTHVLVVPIAEVSLIWCVEGV